MYTAFMIALREGILALVTAVLVATFTVHVLRTAKVVKREIEGRVAALWERYGHRINLGRFLQVTAVFLLLFVVQLAIYAFHELTEADLLPLDNAYWHVATEPYGPEGQDGHWLSYALVAFPLAWLVLSALRTPPPALPPAEERSSA